MMNRSYCCGFTFPSLLLAAVTCVVAAILVSSLVPTFIRSQVNDKVTLLPGHASYEQFTNPTVPLWKSIHFFNITNPDEFQAGKTPVVEVVGPYSYRERRVKAVKELSSDQTILTYTQEKVFYFDPVNSAPGVHENDTICIINLPLIGTIAQVEKFLINSSTIFRDVVVLFFQELFLSIDHRYTQLFVCHEATPLIWNYTDPLVQTLHSEIVLKFLQRALPNPYVQLQLNNSANDAQDSIIYTGVQQIKLLGQYIQWDGMLKLQSWPLPEANTISGTEGLVFHPNLDQSEPLVVFLDDAMRSFELRYVSMVQLLGLNVFRYELPNSTFESAFTNPDNSKWGSWCPDGLFYLGATQDPPIPIFGSKPHFLDGDASLRLYIEGLNPDPSLNRSDYDTRIDVEPITGVNVQTQKVIQLNVQLNKTSDFVQMARLPNDTVYFPILYINEHAEFTMDLKDYLEEHGLKDLHIANIVLWIITGTLSVMAVILFMMSLISCAYFVKLRSNSEERAALITNRTAVQ